MHTTRYLRYKICQADNSIHDHLAYMAEECTVHEAQIKIENRVCSRVYGPVQSPGFVITCQPYGCLLLLCRELKNSKLEDVRIGLIQPSFDKRFSAAEMNLMLDG